MFGDIIGTGALIVFVAAVLMSGVAVTQWILAVRNRVGGVPWWQAALLSQSRLTEMGHKHARRFRRLIVTAVGLWFIAALLAPFGLCCAPPDSGVGPPREQSAGEPR